MARRNVIAIGGSAGASPVLKRVLSELPQDFDASIFVVTHFQTAASSFLKESLQEICPLQVFIAVDGQPIEPGSVYLPSPDRHLIVGRETVRLGAGARENMTRPAIDPLFRSAALAFGPRVIGVVLSGYLNDGAAGLAAIKARAGLAVVQHPLDSDTPDMPEAALAAVVVDATLRQDQMAAALVEMAGREAPSVKLRPDPALELEVRIALGARVGSAELEAIAEPTALTCPHCHGVLSEVKGDGPLRFRCQTGHAFTAETALAGQQAEVDDALLIALRVMEERVTLVSRMGREARQDGRSALAEVYERRADEYSGYARTLREAAMRSLPPLEPAAE